MIKNLNTHILSSFLLLVSIITSEAYTRCLSAGIDPHGPHPNDFDTDDGEKIAFSGESKFALWAAAQSEPAVGLKKKSLPDGTTQPTGIDVVMWTDLKCSGGGSYYYNIKYNTNYYNKKHNRIRRSMQINPYNIYPYSVRIFILNWVPGTTNCVDVDKRFGSTIYAENGCTDLLEPYTCINAQPNL
ncbi:hypothetical protein BDD12DRAFT_876819 [Trichophaea hybrida]|nr:hypothetical protein BDD12DRAFT_876819 [Trichophaea hybrida]